MTQPWFSHRDDSTGPADFCLVCFAYGGVVVRHRPRPVDVPRQAGERRVRVSAGAAA